MDLSDDTKERELISGTASFLKLPIAIHYAVHSCRLQKEARIRTSGWNFFLSFAQNAAHSKLIVLERGKQLISESILRAYSEHKWLIWLSGNIRFGTYSSRVRKLTLANIDLNLSQLCMFYLSNQSWRNDGYVGCTFLEAYTLSNCIPMPLDTHNKPLPTPRDCSRCI